MAHAESLQARITKRTQRVWETGKEPVITYDAISGYISGKGYPGKFSPMPRGKLKSLSAYRRRLKQRGVVRVEVHVRKNDAALVRGVARALSDPAVENETRVLLPEHFGAAKAKGLKELLASAPLEGLDLARKRDVGRKVDL